MLGWALDSWALLPVPPLSTWGASGELTPSFLNTGSVVNPGEAVGGGPAAMSRWERGQGGSDPALLCSVYGPLSPSMTPATLLLRTDG